jgi:predicted metalloprotease with PDZ domain
MPLPGYGSELYGSYMGVDLQEVTHDRMAVLKLREERGAEITMVDHDAPSGKAGLREHDVILEFNGTNIQGVEELRRLIHETAPGRTVQLLISRDGQPTNISLQLADKKEYFAQYPKKLEAHMPTIPVMPEMPPIDVNIHTGSTYGLVVEGLTRQLGEYFGVKNGEGVLVKSVEEGTPAKTAGFRAGDVIVRVNNQKIADRGDWRTALRGHRSGKLIVGIVRDRHEQNLTLNLPPSSRDHSTLELPSVEDLNIDVDLGQLQAALREMRPELEHLRVDALKEAGEGLKNGRRAMDVNEKELKRAMDQAKKVLDYEMKHWQKELGKARESQRAEY